ncbi:MAG: phosphate signaling complex protein PhoU [Deltaproteobacteria bacterium]|nr:phosphate signaling complex protein PhoU [Deltaproteobacteria bacterium]
MPALLQKELEKLKKQILFLGAMVEEHVDMAMKAVEKKDAALAEEIIKADLKVDELEVEIEEECLKLLALYQPVAEDLRFIIAVIKINHELERVGDEAVNIAERMVYISTRQPVPVAFDYKLMSEKTRAMLKSSLDAFVNMDEETANQVRLKDDEVDAINREIYDHVKQSILENPDRGGYLINLFSIARNLERIADHATNIAEEVIYLIEGIIQRHKKI